MMHGPTPKSSARPVATMAWMEDKVRRVQGIHICWAVISCYELQGLGTVVTPQKIQVSAILSGTVAR